MTGAKRTQRVQQARRREQQALPSFRARRWGLLALLWLCFLALIGRAVDQQIFETDFLQQEGKNRHLRVVEVPAHRGMILDRHGEPLAISTPVASVWANPRLLTPDNPALASLAKILGADVKELRRHLAERSDRAFTYLAHWVNPDVAQQLHQLMEKYDLDINALGLQKEFRRYYPTGEVLAQVVGFTDINDAGQEGMELEFDHWLRGAPGSKRVIQDGKRRAVQDVENIRAADPGKSLVLSLDWRLQYLAYRELKSAVLRYKARAGTAVILDARTGEVLAMVNQPSYNPNDLAERHGGALRNRAMTDMFEPGSTMKPFTMACALEQGKVRPDTKIDTAPGILHVGNAVVRDARNYGLIDVATVIRKSSNVGISKIALSLPLEKLLYLLRQMGFGVATGSGFPGESGGVFNSTKHWSQIGQATLAFGYGLSVTPLQLAQAYMVLAADGVRRPVSLVRLDHVPEGEAIIKPETARVIRKMLEGVVSPGGTAPAAAVKGYRVAGKTGTVKKIVGGAYSEDRYFALFAGMAPAEDPRLVMVVVIDEPKGDKYYGGLVAAPVFSRVMAGALRILNIPPDRDLQQDARLAGVGVGG